MISSNVLPSLIQQILSITIYGEQSTIAQPVTIGTPSFVESDHFTQFDFMAPGMFVFAVIFITMIVAEGFTVERAEGLLQRLQVTPTTPTDIITSSVIAYMVTALIQVFIVFIVSGLMGFNPQTDISGIVFAFVIVLIFALINIGFGLITASIAKNPGSATGISFVFIMPQMLFGTFVPVPEIIGQLVPSYYVTDALTSVLLRGASITSSTVLFDFGITVVVSMTVIIAGIVIFAKYGKD
jgi:ABC-2 type transport system permease protein